MSRIAYVNGEFLPLEAAKISILDRGFIFADGIYEVTAVLDGRLVDYDNHIARLWRSLGEIKLACPVDAARLLELHRSLIERNRLTEGSIYLQVTRGVAERDFPFPKDVPSSLVMFTQIKSLIDPPAAKTGIKVLSLPDLRWSRRDIKSVALLAQVLAKQAAAEVGCQEAWMLDGDKITEGGSSTAFIVNKDRHLITRPLSRAILPGITRKAVLALAEQEDLRLEERPFSLEEAYGAEEAFISSATSFVMPVVEIDRRPIGTGRPGPLAARLRELYLEKARLALGDTAQHDA